MPMQKSYRWAAMRHYTTKPALPFLMTLFTIYYGSLLGGAPMVTGDGEGDQDPSSWRGAG